MKLVYLYSYSCTIFYIYYTKLIYVSAIYPDHFQGVTSLVDVYSVYGLDIWLKHVGVLYNEYKNTMQLIGSQICVH